MWLEFHKNIIICLHDLTADWQKNEQIGSRTRVESAFDYTDSTDKIMLNMDINSSKSVVFF